MTNRHTMGRRRKTQARKMRLKIFHKDARRFNTVEEPIRFLRDLLLTQNTAKRGLGELFGKPLLTVTELRKNCGVNDIEIL